MKTHKPGNVRVVFDDKYAWFHRDIVSARSTADPELRDGNCMFSPDCNNQVGRGVYMETIAGWNDRGRAVFRDDGWARIFLARFEGVAGADCCRQLFAVEPHRSFAP